MTVTSVFRTLVSIMILCGLSIGGDAVSGALNLPVPGPILGMIVLLGLLGAVPKLQIWAAPAADFLVRWLGALIVPAAAGIVLYGEVFKTHGLALAAVLIITTLLTGLAIAVIYRATTK